MPRGPRHLFYCAPGFAPATNFNDERFVGWSLPEDKNDVLSCFVDGKLTRPCGNAPHETAVPTDRPFVVEIFPAVVAKRFELNRSTDRPNGTPPRRQAI